MPSTEVQGLPASASLLQTLNSAMYQRLLSSLDESLSRGENTLRISLTMRPKKAKKGEGKRLITLDAEEIPESGPCPGGVYHYVTDKQKLIEMLTMWTRRKVWAAIDLETGVAWRQRPDPESDDLIRYYEPIIDPHTCPIYLVSLSVEPGVAVVFDMRLFREDKEFLTVWRDFLATCKLIAHNSMFEQSFLCAQFGVVCNFVYDTMLVNQLMTAGLETSSRLGDLLDHYCGLKLDKEWQKLFLSIDYQSPLPAEAIAYSAGDVSQLLVLAQKLDEQLTESGLRDVWTHYELPFMKWIALAKVEGIAINHSFFETVNKELAVAQQQTYDKFCALCPNVLISSPPQLKAWFAKQGILLRSTNVDTLAKLVDLPAIGEVAATILAFRKIQKMRGTYVEPMLQRFPSPVTGHVHPNWGQLYTATGRMNCNDPAVQTIPARGEWVKLRSGFTAKPGHKLVYCDFSQFEVRAMADMADEERMIEVFREAMEVTEEFSRYCSEHGIREDIADLYEKDPAAYKVVTTDHPTVDLLVRKLANLDFHRRTASMLHGVPVEDVTKSQRSNAKSVTFGKVYGAGPRKIAQQAGIEVEEAARIFKDYDAKFPKLAKYLETCRENAKKGSTQSPSGRKRFYQPPNFASVYAKIKTLCRAKGPAWEALTETWGSDDVHRLSEKIHSAKIGAVEREGMNHPIQAANADATKLATILAAPRLKKLHEDITIIAWVHDEIILTAPEAVAEQAGNILRLSMIEAAERLLTKTPIDVSCTIAATWGK